MEQGDKHLVELIHGCSTTFVKGKVCLLKFTSTRKDFKLINIDKSDNKFEYPEQEFGFTYIGHIKFIT